MNRHKNKYQIAGQVAFYHSFEEMVKDAFSAEINAHCWQRQVSGDFAAIVNQIKGDDDIELLDKKRLMDLSLDAEGEKARQIILEDLSRLTAIGAEPILNLIRPYPRDDAQTFFPTDVYSFHVDRAPLPVSTYLCTYYGAASDILPNDQAEQKIQIASIRNHLQKGFVGDENAFEAYLEKNYFDLHYQAKADANIINCGNGNLWRLAVDCSGSGIKPCIHRAPEQKAGESRLLLIC